MMSHQEEVLLSGMGFDQVGSKKGPIEDIQRPLTFGIDVNSVSG
jgi:hypothetical protein